MKNTLGLQHALVVIIPDARPKQKVEGLVLFVLVHVITNKS
jgi:hypothetical protein